MSIIFPGLVVSAAVILSVFPISNVDIWWHLKTGQIILEQRALPTHDLFTYTIPSTTRWYDVQWLFQVIIAVLYGTGGWNALILLRVLSVVIFAMILWRWIRERGFTPLVSFLCVYVILLASRYRFWLRPELFSFALIALELRFFDRARRSGKIPWIPLILTQWLWANLHSSCILGLFMAVVFLIERHLTSSTKRISKKHTSNLLFFIVLFFSVTLLNPNGWVQVLYGISEGTKFYIEEFQPPRWQFFISASGLILLMVLISIKKVFFPQHRFLSLVSAGFLVQTLRMNRFFPYLGISLATLQAEGWTAVLNSGRRARLTGKIIVILFVVTVLVISTALTLSTEKKNPLRVGIDEKGYPAAAVEFIIREDIRGRLFSVFDDGGFLVWRLYPGRKVFYFNETRLNELPLEQFIAMKTSADVRRLFEEYQVTYAIIPCNYSGVMPEGSTLAQIILSWHDWTMVFWDDYAIVFVKNIPEFHEIIAARRCIVSPELIPYQDNNLANMSMIQEMLENPDMRSKVESELIRAYRESPHHLRAAFALGVLYDSSESTASRALEYYKAAEAMDPNLPEILNRLGQWYLRYNDISTGLDYFRRAIRYSESRDDAMFNLALAQYRAGLIDDSRKTVDSILQRNPNHTRALKLKQRITSP